MLIWLINGFCQIGTQKKKIDLRRKTFILHNVLGILLCYYKHTVCIESSSFFHIGGKFKLNAGSGSRSLAISDILSVFLLCRARATGLIYWVHIASCLSLASFMCIYELDKMGCNLWSCQTATMKLN